MFLAANEDEPVYQNHAVQSNNDRAANDSGKFHAHAHAHAFSIDTFFFPLHNMSLHDTARQVSPLLRPSVKDNASSHSHTLVVADRADRFPSLSLSFPDEKVHILTRPTHPTYTKYPTRPTCTPYVHACNILSSVQAQLYILSVPVGLLHTHVPVWHSYTEGQ